MSIDYLFAALSLVSLVLAVGYGWQGPAGVFWIIGFIFGFLAVPF